MAFVFERPNSPFWYMGYTSATGEQKKKSTGLKKKLVLKKVAKAFAQKMEDAEHQAHVGTITDARARALLSELVEKATGAPMTFHTVENWLGTWLDGKETTKARSTFLCYRKAVKDFLEHLGAERIARGIELVTVRDFQSFRDKQVAQGKTPQTANNVLKALRIPFSLARKQGLIPMNPAEAVERLGTERVSRSPFTQDQLRSLIAAAEGDWKGAILAGIYTGQRLRDIANLRWEAVDLSARTVAFTQIPGCFRGDQLQRLLYLNPAADEQPICQRPPLRDGPAEWLRHHEKAKVSDEGLNDPGSAPGLASALAYYSHDCRKCADAARFWQELG